MKSTNAWEENGELGAVELHYLLHHNAILIVHLAANLDLVVVFKQNVLRLSLN